MSDRKQVVAKVLELKEQGKLPTSVQSDNLKTDQRGYEKLMNRSGIKGVGVSTEPGRNLLWFWSKK